MPDCRGRRVDGAGELGCEKTIVEISGFFHYMTLRFVEHDVIQVPIPASIGK